MGTVRGNHKAAIEDRLLTFQFTFAAMENLQAAYGADWETVVRDGMAKLDVALIVKVAAAGLAAHHPDLTEAALRKWSPPLLPLVAAVSRAFVVAWHGAEPPPEGKQKREEETRRDLTRFWKLWSWRNGWASRQGSSGGSAPLN